MNRNSATDTAPNSAIVRWKPSTSFPPPKKPTSGRTPSDTRKPPPKAPRNRTVESETRSASSSVITPIKAEYGTLIAVYAILKAMKVAYANASLAVSPTSGLVNISQPSSP